MARVERFTSQEQIPVQQAQLIDPRGFPADTSSAEALKVAADTAKVMAELAKRRRDAQDSLAATKASKARTQMDMEMRQAMLDEPDPDKWEKLRAKISAKYGASYASLKMSEKMRKEQDVEQQAADNELRMNVQLAATKQDIENDKLEAATNLIDLMANDDGSKRDAQEIKVALERLEAAHLRDTTPEIAEIRMEETLRVAKKGYWINQSRRTDEDFDIDVFIAQMQKKKAKVKGGEDKDGLNAKDMDDIIASAYNAKALAEKSLDTKQELDRDELGQALHDGTIDYTMINATSLDEKEQESFRIKMNAEAERKAKGVVIETNETVKGELEAMAYDISTGAVTVPEFRNRLTEERYTNKTIDDDVYDELFSLAERKFEGYQAGAMKGRESFALTQLVTYSSELSWTERLKQLTSQFEREQESTLRQLQFDNLDQYKRALRRWLEKPKNKDANADEIYFEGRRLLTHYRKTPDQLRKEAEPTKPEVVPLTQEQKEKMGRGIQGALTKGLTGQPKAVKSIKNVTEPKDKREFINKLRELQEINPDLSLEYYNKYLDKFW